MKKIFTFFLFILFVINTLKAQTTFEVDSIAYKIISTVIPYKVEVNSKTTKYIGNINIPEQVIFNHYCPIKVQNKI